MAPFTFDLLDEEQKKKKDEAQDEGMGAPAMTGGGASFGGGDGASSPLQAPEQKGVRNQGSGFVNLNKYMQANQGNDFGSQFTGKVQGDVSSAKQGLEKNAQDFSQASNQGTTRWNDVGGSVKNIVDSAGDNTSKDDASKLQGYTQAQYQGPENFLGSAYGSQAQSGVNKSAQEAKALQSEGGRFALLDQFYGRPKYNSGQKSLDNLLVQNTPGVAAKAQSIGNQAKQVESQAGQTSQDLGNLVAQNKFATQDTAKQTQDYLGKAVTDFDTGLQNRYGDYKSSLDAYNQDRRADLSDNFLDDQTMSLLGLGQGQRVYDLNLANYVRDATSPASLGQFASDQDYAKYLALQQLAGEDPTLLRASDRSKAGTTGDLGKVSVDQDALKRDISQRADALKGVLAPDALSMPWGNSSAADLFRTGLQAGGDYPQFQSLVNSGDASGALSVALNARNRIMNLPGVDQALVRSRWDPLINMLSPFARTVSSREGLER